jgi:hypothetical protein
MRLLLRPGRRLLVSGRPLRREPLRVRSGEMI